MKQLSRFTQTGLLGVLVLSLVTLVSCKDDEPGPAITNEANYKVNSWILDEMEFWYLWNTSLPGNPDKNAAPPDFFESLLYHEDRFSWIQDDYEELLKSLQGISKEPGFEFILYKEPSNNNVFAQVLYVKPGSPAAQTALKRGDVITNINNTQIDVNNYQALVGALSENHTLSYRSLDIATGEFGTAQTLSITPVEFSENPNFLSEIIEVDDRKIGYYVYNFFATGTSQSPNTYKDQMDAIFGEFKNAGITDLVLDLRFNNGGSETAARDLASYVGAGVDNTKVFSRKEYNSLVEEAIINDPQLGEEFLVSKFDAKGNNVGNLLTDKRVYVLTSSRTASASELVINALKPYMDVFLIGEVTYGKNVGSISLQDDGDPSNKWGMQPIVVKIYNSLDQSDYTNGFAPDVLNEDNSLHLYPLGDQRETMLASAIGQITGSATAGRVEPGEGQYEIGHSLDYKRRSFELVIDQNVPDIKH